MIDVDIAALANLRLTDAGRRAARVMIDDMNALDALGRDPVLNCIRSYAHDERALAIRTDVMSFHADRAPIECETFLCTYWGKSSEGLDNDDARKLVDVPELRARLLREYGGADGAGFTTFLREASFDLHYDVVDETRRPFSFGVGNLWRVAVEWPGCPVPPCLHRAPAMRAGDEPRLLLIC